MCFEDSHFIHPGAERNRGTLTVFDSIAGEPSRFHSTDLTLKFPRRTRLSSGTFKLLGLEVVPERYWCHRHYSSKGKMCKAL